MGKSKEIDFGKIAKEFNEEQESRGKDWRLKVRRRNGSELIALFRSSPTEDGFNGNSNDQAEISAKHTSHPTYRVNIFEEGSDESKNNFVTPFKSDDPRYREIGAALDYLSSASEKEVGNRQIASSEEFDPDVLVSEWLVKRS